ncbi:hypothetical protein C2W62_32825 [Candidatus Entotheonella serta]|nr:hypothetical protein C2W62_32825 [Candidatus Entotheonella serta]
MSCPQYQQKRSVTLDSGSTTGRHVLATLLQQADVVLHQHTPDMADASPLQTEALRHAYPRLVVAGITPFGQFGPYSGNSGTELTSCALSGLSEGLGENDRSPLVAPFGQAGYQAGLSAASATVLALLVREMSGQGQAIDIAEADVLATLQTGVYLNNFHFDGTKSMRGHRFGSRTIYPASFYRCRDGFMWVTAPQWAQWERLLEMIGRAELAEDERFHNRRRIADNPPPELDVHQCREARLPIAPVYHIDELIAHPNLSTVVF